jgi:membrane associated rhomboid family serine protease
MTEGPLSLPLRGGREIVFLEDALRHPRTRRLRGERHTPYRDITHLFAGGRWIRLATRGGVWLIPRAAFVRPEDGDRLVRECLHRIAASPGGAEQLAHLARVEERQRRPARLRCTVGLVALCGLVFLAQLAAGGLLEEVAAFGATLARVEPWRYLSGNLLHATFLPPHFFLNALAILAFGALVERPLGGLATCLVMGVSAVFAMAGAAVAGLEAVVGASGVASGLVGALLWLELRHGGELPAAWRLPRRLFVTFVVLEHVILLPVPGVAVSGHLGGMLGGALCTALVAPACLSGERPGWLRAAAGVTALALVASLAAVGVELARGADRLQARRGERLLGLESAPPGILNDTAWLIALAETRAPRDLEVALRLAERAVRLSARRDPNLLDTLAEVLFQAGRTEEALDVIDEAIRLAPTERYYREQRRRFRGERPFDDRPSPPGFPELPEDSGVRV